ncbi:MAG: PAS domain-containing protein [Alphaproteobacteria bacterium]|nr:PAS domain-containing protein [Alphaproteobacteria bacterium]
MSDGEIKFDPAPANQSAETRLKQLEAHFALAERTARIGYWRHEITAKYPTWSPGFFTLLEIDPKDVRPSPKWLLDRMHPDDRPAVTAAVTAAMTQGTPFYYRTRGFKPNGDIHLYDTYGDVERGPDGSIVAVLGVVQDVTAKVAAENALRDSEAAYRFMAEEASDIIARHGPDGRLTFISPAVRRILGFEPSEMLKRGPYDGAHPDDIDAVKDALQQARRTTGTANYTYRVYHRDGHTVWLETHLRFVRNPQTGTFDGAISVTRDITERKQVEDELTRARERAEAASHTKSRFLANMSHELRTPLNAIIGFSDILAREMFGPMGSERYQEYSRLINESGTMLLDLINDLLDMSKIEAGKFELHYETFSAGEALSSCVRLIEKRAEEKGVTMRSTVEPENLFVHADQRAVKQILLNLLSNAVKFTNSGGAVDAIIRQSGTTVSIVVRDTGVGIPADVLPRLAQPFEQASSDASRMHGGSGLGLALVKSLTRLHGGDLRITSEEGRGTEVTATLPSEPKVAATRVA